MRGTFLAGFVLFVAATPAVAQEPADATYYLHPGPECDGSTSFIDRQNTEGDLDSCGNSGAAQITQGNVPSSYALAYPGRARLDHWAPAGTEATLHFFLFTNVPQSLTVEIDVVVGDATCRGTGSATVNTPYGFTDHVVACALEGLGTPHSLPQLNITVRGTHYFAGYEGDHVSRLDLTGLDPVVIDDASQSGPAAGSASASATGPGAGPDDAPNGRSPSLGALPAIAAAGFVVAALTHRRGRRA